MSTLTVRRVPEEIVERLKAAAARHGRSMEQEVRELLAERYPTRAEVIARVRERWERFAAPSAEQVEGWIENGR